LIVFIGWTHVQKKDRPGREAKFRPAILRDGWRTSKRSGVHPIGTKAALVVASGPESGMAYQLGPEPTLLGRLAPCQVILPASGVSRQHARIVCRDDGYFIEDLDSLNGTFVNAERLRAPRRLEQDDQIQIHETLLAFTALPVTAAEPSAVADTAPPATKDTSVVAALDVHVGSQSRVEVNAEIKLRAILDIIRSVGEARDIDQALTDVLDHMFEIFPQADHGFVLLLDPQHDRLAPRAVKHRQEGAEECTMGPIDNRIARQAMRAGQALLSASSPSGEPAGPSDTVFDISLRAIMCAPLVAPSSTNLGVLQLVTDDAQRQFAHADLDVLASAGMLVGQLVDYARRYERRGAEGALKRSESRFRALVEKCWDSIAILDAEGVVTYAAVGMPERLENALAPRIGCSAFEKIHADDRPIVMRLFGELLADSGGSRTAEYRMQSAAGASRWLEATATNLLHDPDVRGIVCNYRDITGRKQIEEERLRLLADEREARAEAERLSHMKDEFLATLSHELRTPLNAIVGWADLLQMGKLAGPEMAQGIETIQRNARMQTKIIEDLLDMSRIISGRTRLEIQPVDVERLVLAAVETVQPAAQAKSIRLEMDCHNCPPIKGDPARLQQVLWNLLTNAVKFTPPEGTVAIRAASRGDQVEIRIIDSGEGMDPDFLPHAFERFRQADSSPTRRHGGLGLGLAIVKQLVESHGGSIVAESAGRGQGSTFAVRLPRAFTPTGGQRGKHSDDDDSEAEPELRIDGVDVLVVDDQRDSRELVAHVLVEAGARVRSCGSAHEALDLFRAQPPTVLLADIAMPLMDGYELITAIRAFPPERGGQVPAVAITAFAHAEGRRRSQMAGFQIHMAKPIDREQLVAAVSRLASVKPA
jgi:PAS domain S-box-containing protein